MNTVQAKLAALKKTSDDASVEQNKSQTKPEELAGKQEFQQYNSAKLAMRMVTPTGFRITFTKHTYLTQNVEAIAYLDSEIANGLRGITKGPVLNTDDLDPMTALKKKHYAEFKALQEAELLAEHRGEFADMGTTEGASNLKTLSSKQTAS